LSHGSHAAEPDSPSSGRSSCRSSDPRKRRIFSDPLALRTLGDDPELLARQAEEDPASRGMRLFLWLCGHALQTMLWPPL